mgnify:CR=1 FL=1
MTEACHNTWKLKVSRNTTSAPKLQTLPPTNEAFRENVSRTPTGYSLERCCEPPDLNPTEFVWEKGNNGELN